MKDQAVDIRVRDATPADAAGIARVGRSALPQTFAELIPDPVVVDSIVAQSYAEEALAECIGRCALDATACFLVAEEDGRIVGFLHYDELGAEPELHRIYLDPSCLRRGVGSALMDELHGRLAPAAEYVLMVVAANEPAVSFYRRHGLTVDRRVDGVRHMREQMGVAFPPGAPEVPALIMRFTKQ
jgi:diamine N-acetyltransferase